MKASAVVSLCLGLTHNTWTTHFAYPSLLTLVSSHLCTQSDKKTNRDKLTSSGLARQRAKFNSSTSPPLPLSSACLLHGYSRNLTTHWFRLSQQSAHSGHFLWPTLSSRRAWFHTTCLFLPAKHMQSTGCCGGCSQWCVILIRQD